MDITGQWARLSDWWKDSFRQRLGPVIAGKLTLGEALLFVLLTGLFAVVPFAISQSQRADQVLSETLLTIYNLGAIILLLLAGRATIKQAEFQINSQQVIRRVARAWQILGLGLSMNILGELIWIGLTWLGRASFPSLADIFYLGAYPVIVIGIMLLPFQRRTRLEAYTKFLEILAISLSAGLYVWNYLAKPLSDARMVINRLEDIFTMAYPLFDLLMLMALIAIVYRSVEWVRPAPLLFLAAGISLWVIGDVILSLKVIAATYQPGGPADSIHLLSYVFWGLAGLSQIFSVREGLYARRRSTKPWVTKWGEATPTFRAFIPPAVLLVTFLLLWQGYNQKLPLSFNHLLGWTGVLLFLTTLVQLLHLYRDRQINLGLQKTNAELERRVAERTRTLSNMTEALRMSEAHYRAVVEDTPVLVCTFQEDGNLTFVNQAYAAYFNRVPDELVGRSFYSLISPEERQTVEKNIRSLSRENPVLMHEYSVTAPNGELRWQRWVNRMVIEGANIKFQAIGEDITDRRIAEERLRESEERYRLLFETMAQGVVYQDAQGRILSANPAAEQILGLPLNQMQGEQLSDPSWESIREDGTAFPDEEHPSIVAIRTGKEVNNVVMGVTNPRDGQRRWINIHAVPQVLPGEEQPVRIYTTFEDITERKLGELALRDANLRLSRGVEELSLLARLDELLQLCQTDQEAYQAIDTVIEHIFSGERGSIFVVNAEGAYQARVVWGHMGDTEPISQSQCMALRYGRPYLVEDTRHGLLCDHVRPKAPVSSLCVPMIAQNEVYGSLHIEVELKNGKNGGLDETRRKLASMVGNSIALALSNIHLRDRLREQAVRDPLTGLFNRRFMEESLKRELLRVERSKQTLAVLMMDIDHFKVYNDTYGHEAGDLLLTEVAKLIRTRIRGSDIACRYGGEEIVLVIPDVAETTALERAEKLRIEISQLRLPYGDEILEPVTVSIGVSMCPKDGLTPQELLRRADQALYTAKEAGRNRVSL